MSVKKILNSMSLLFQIIFFWPLILYIYLKVQRTDRIRERENSRLLNVGLSTPSN